MAASGATSVLYVRVRVKISSLNKAISWSEFYVEITHHPSREQIGYLAARDQLVGPSIRIARNLHISRRNGPMKSASDMNAFAVRVRCVSCRTRCREGNYEFAGSRNSLMNLCGSLSLLSVSRISGFKTPSLSLFRM